MTAQELIKLAV